MHVIRIWRATPLLAAIALLTWQTGSTVAGPTAGGHWPPVGSSSSSSASPSAPSVAVPASAAARLEVKLPQNARLWIEGKEIEQQSTSYSLTSPPLEAGYNYTYHLRSQWTDNGVQVTRERAVPIHAGETVTVDFMPAPPAQGK
jgi:uncharacterized protein (TIGR03000 family)